MQVVDGNYTLAPGTCPWWDAARKPAGVPNDHARGRATTLNITETIDNSKVGSFQIGIFVLCGLCLIMDGFDVQSWGYVGAVAVHEWGIASAAGRVASCHAIGVLIGSLLFSMLADKIGRRPVLIGATLYFSALTLITAQRDVARISCSSSASSAASASAPSCRTPSRSSASTARGGRG